MLLSDMVSMEKENTLQHQQQHISHKVGVLFPNIPFKTEFNTCLLCVCFFCDDVTCWII